MIVGLNFTPDKDKNRNLTTNKLISIIVPCYNQASYLSEALQSVLDQTYTNWECIIVDDGSPDNTESIAQQWCARDTRFKYIKKPNGGVSSTRNRGIDAALGTYILPLDGDDKISSNYVEGCLNEFERNPLTKVVYGKAVFFGAQTGEWPLPDFDYTKQLSRNLIFCTAMYRKADWAAIGGYDEQMLFGLEDWDFWLRFIQEQDVVTRVPSILFSYRIKESSRNTDLYKDQTRKEQTYLYLYQKHYEKMRHIIGNPIQLYVEKDELEQHAHRLEAVIAHHQKLAQRSLTQKIIDKLKSLMSQNTPSTQTQATPALTPATQRSGKLSSIKNKIKANTGNDQSFKEIVQSAFFYLTKKGIIHRVKDIVRFFARKVYVLLESKHVVILNGQTKTLIYAKDPYSYWRSKHEITKKDYRTISQHISIFKSHPVFSVIINVQAVDELLEKSIRSFTEQVYTKAKLFVVAPSASNKEAIQKLLQERGLNTPQIIVLVSGELENEIRKETATDHFVMNLKQGDMLTADALYDFAYHSLVYPDAQIIYSDEDYTDGDEAFYNPLFKPDWSPDNLRSFNYIQRSVVFQLSLLQQIEGWEKKWENGNDYDLILRASEKARAVAHSANILYHTFDKVESAEESAHIYNTNKAALEAAMQRGTETGEIEDSAVSRGIFIPRYKLKTDAKVSIIIPTKDKIDILKTCIDSIVQKSTYKNFEIVLIDNNSSTPEFFEQVNKWKAELPNIFTCIRTEEPFNFAFLMNFGAKHCTGSYYVLLNNDTEVITPNWIELMMEQAQRSSIGVVGAKLLYPTQTIQHAGVVLGLSGLVDHVFVGTPRYGQSYQNYIHRVINYSALTAACLMVSKQKFDQVNGFNELFQVEFNDIDFCLRLKEAGYNHVYLPHVELFHHESISRGHPFANPVSYERHLREFALFKNTWQKYIDNDPCYSPNLSLKDRNMKVNY